MPTKALLKISGCKVPPGGTISVDPSRPSFKALINPPGYDHNFSVSYVENKNLGKGGNEAKFNTVESEKFVLKSLVLDGTGAVPGTKEPVSQQVKQLRDTVYTYVGTLHQPPIVQVAWGSLLFYGRIQSLKFDYTLFAANGEPLRAKVSLSFLEYTSAAEQVKQDGASSPDLTHLIVVKAGDTLPLLCERIYRDPAYHSAVARINGLTLLRQLEPGMRLRFPPLA
jgi:hypothetical protein